ncbi:hypothetical protein EDB86DRAFT_3085124 [Lactarius hatsudake]|nr:hypothetical protein EDB86DRAFT_3085124 [Lactarius hatsudake]
MSSHASAAAAPQNKQSLINAKSRISQRSAAPLRPAPGASHASPHRGPSIVVAIEHRDFSAVHATVSMKLQPEHSSGLATVSASAASSARPHRSDPPISSNSTGRLSKHRPQTQEYYATAYPYLAPRKQQRLLRVFSLSRRDSIGLPPRVISCQDLEAKDRNGYSDPFVTVSLLVEQFQTPVRESNLNPVYDKDATFDFPIYMSLVHVLGTLDFVVWDKDRIRNDYMGEYSLPVDRWIEGIAFVFDDPDNEPVRGSMLLKVGFVRPPGSTGQVDFENTYNALIANNIHVTVGVVMDKFKADDYVGEAEISIDTLINGADLNTWPYPADLSTFPEFKAPLNPVKKRGRVYARVYDPPPTITFRKNDKDYTQTISHGVLTPLPKSSSSTPPTDSPQSDDLIFIDAIQLGRQAHNLEGPHTRG